MLRPESVVRLAALMAVGWFALCLFWETTDKFYRGEFWPWLLIGLAFIALLALAVAWGLQQGGHKATQGEKRHQP